MSIYLNKNLAKKIDQQANQTKMSRSKLISEILEQSLLNKKQQSVFDEVFGILDLQETKDFLEVIRNNRKNSHRFK